MAIVFVPLNGIGLGHLSRSFALARELREWGDAPVIFSQGIYPEFMAAEIPGRSVGALYKITSAQRSRIAREIAEFARRSAPAVVIEDTHPSDIRFERDICTLLIVRPTELGTLRELRARESRFFRAFLMADHPESPTWPYDAEGTAEILSWPEWKIMGPVFRSPTPEGRERICRKYSLRRDQPLYVFTMGGGGSQPGGHDAGLFVDRSAAIASRIENRTPGARFVFIRGPLFPPDLKVPLPFETYSVENDMPSLMAEARGVVGRPSFNTTWESIAAGVPLMPVPGQTYFEPVADRLQRMTQAGLLTLDLDEWGDLSWRARFRDKAAAVSSRWPLRGAAQILRSCWT